MSGSLSSLWTKRPAWKSVLEEMGNPGVRADAGRCLHRVAARIAGTIRSALSRGEGGPSPAALRAASAREGLSPQPVRLGGTIIGPVREAARALSLLLVAPALAMAQTEFHYQYGTLANPFSGKRAATHILTFQQASSWSHGDSFFFIDFLDDRGADGFNEKNFYGEWYPTLSLGELAGRTVGTGRVRDLALIAGVNFDGDADVFKWSPGVRLSWDLPGFAFFNTDLTALLDASSGVERGGAPKTSDTLVFDVNWGAAFDLGGQSFWFSGHAEYLGAGTDELGDPVRAWILAQPHLGWDVGKALTGSPNQLFVGLEYQYWWNKLGEDSGDNAAHLWVMWRP